MSSKPMSSKDERYIEIARACLKAVNQSVSGEADLKDGIQRVYEAIDHAFKREFLNLETSLEIGISALKKIQQLEGHNKLAQAQDIAEKALDKIESPTDALIRH